ncbi:hypothetical protein EYF80_060879 [Liparis tanakae]|uniref:Uncharacterized protein n=1 Tax=Liparis tanakae TaxID=230148 RepID=A0A4Z2EK04_9TELE|nr:hypothetical protein EYF80_060879 [Liparis tanakae]
MRPKSSSGDPRPPSRGRSLWRVVLSVGRELRSLSRLHTASPLQPSRLPVLDPHIPPCSGAHEGIVCGRRVNNTPALRGSSHRGPEQLQRTRQSGGGRRNEAR